MNVQLTFILRRQTLDEQMHWYGGCSAVRWLRIEAVADRTYGVCSCQREPSAIDLTQEAVTLLITVKQVYRTRHA